VEYQPHLSAFSAFSPLYKIRFGCAGFLCALIRGDRASSVPLAFHRRDTPSSPSPLDPPTWVPSSISSFFRHTLSLHLLVFVLSLVFILSRPPKMNFPPRLFLSRFSGFSQRRLQAIEEFCLYFFQTFCTWPPFRAQGSSAGGSHHDSSRLLFHPFSPQQSYGARVSPRRPSPRFLHNMPFFGPPTKLLATLLFHLLFGTLTLLRHLVFSPITFNRKGPGAGFGYLDLQEVALNPNGVTFPSISEQSIGIL